MEKQEKPQGENIELEKVKSRICEAGARQEKAYYWVKKGKEACQKIKYKCNRGDRNGRRR